MKNIWILFLSLTLFGCRGTEEIEEQQEGKAQLQIVSIGGSITENVVDLGLIENIVGIDITSNYPESVMSKKQLGHSSGITGEGIISTKANLVLAFDGKLNKKILSGLDKAGIKYHLFKEPQSLEESYAFLNELGEVLGKEKEAKELVEKLKGELAKAEPLNKQVVFVYARGAGTLMVSGKNTSISNFIELAGAENAVTEFEDFKPLTPEALANANPDIVLFFDSGLQSLGGIEGLAKIPGLAETNAVKNGHVISMPASFISNFGSRYPEAIKEFRSKVQGLTHE